MEKEKETNEEMGRKLIDDMETALIKDINSLKQKKPALEKIKLLPQIENMMRKIYMQEFLLSQNILNIFARWLQPPKKGLLPSFEIRSKLLELLNVISTSKWDQHHEEIKISQIGKLIKTFINHPKETSENKSLSQKLIDKWTRSIVSESEYNDYYNNHKQITPSAQ